MCCDMLDLVMDISDIYSRGADPKSVRYLPYDVNSFSQVVLENGTVSRRKSKKNKIKQYAGANVTLQKVLQIIKQYYIYPIVGYCDNSVGYCDSRLDYCDSEVGYCDCRLLGQ